MPDLSEYQSHKRSSPISYTVTPMDRALIEFIADFHGCSKSEAVRISVRSYAAVVVGFEKKIGRKSEAE